MKHIAGANRIATEILTIGVVLIVATGAVFGKDKAKMPDEDRIRVIAHIPLDGKAQRNLTVTEHWRKQYLYMESADGDDLTIVDVTSPAAPVVTQRVHTSATRVMSVVGTAILVASDPADRTPPPAQTLSILSVSPEGSTKLVQEFKGVTSVLRAGAQIYIVNAEGLWVLQQDPAMDKQLEKEYSDYVLYNR
jgi:hypothetical protein